MPSLISVMACHFICQMIIGLYSYFTQQAFNGIINFSAMWGGVGMGVLIGSKTSKEGVESDVCVKRMP